MMRLNREQGLFAATLAIVALLSYGLYRSYRTAPLTPPKSQPADPLALAKREARPLGRDDPAWADDARNIFAEPREEQDLPPLDLPLPPLPDLPWIAPPVPPGPSARALTAIRVPASVAAPPVAAPVEPPSGGEDPAASAPPANGAASGGSSDPPDDASGSKPQGGAAMASPSSAPAPPGGSKASPAAEKKPTERYDRIHTSKKELLYGRIELPDPISVAGEEIEPGRFRLRAGQSFQFHAFDLKTNRRLSGLKLGSEDVDWFELADTPENAFRVRLHRVGDNVGKDRLALARWCESQKLFEHAEEQYRLVKAIDPADAREAAIGAAGAAVARWRFEEARAILAAAVAATPDDAALEVAAGRIEVRLGLTGLAESSFRRALRLDPGQWSAATQLARICSSRGDLAEAREIFQKVAAGTAPAEERAEAQNGLARIALKEGKLDEALAAASRAAELLPGAESLALRASILDAKGDRAGAERAVEEALVFDPECPAALRGLAVLKARSDSPAAAIDVARQAWLADPAHPFWPLVAKGYALLRQTKREEALAAFREASLASPAEPYGHYLLGRFSVLLGNIDAAAESFHRALELAPDFVECALALADVSLREDDREAAQRYLGYVRAFAAETPESGGLLAYSYLLQRRMTDAEAEFAKAREKNPDDRLATAGLAYIQYRKGGDGVFRAVQALKELADKSPEHPNDPYTAYAKEWRDSIVENINKVVWTDSFGRDQIKQGWQENERGGPTVSLEKQRVKIGGTQREEGKVSSLERLFDDGARLLLYQVALEAAPATNAYIGISVLKPAQNQADGIYFGKDPRGRVVYRAISKGKADDWTVVEGAQWPSSGPVTLAIERSPSEATGWRLLLNGKPVVAAVPQTALPPRLAGQVRLGFFGQADIGVDWVFYSDDVRVVLTKKT